jgi:hypothetical protein
MTSNSPLSADFQRFTNPLSSESPKSPESANLPFSLPSRKEILDIFSQKLDKATDTDPLELTDFVKKILTIDSSLASTIWDSFRDRILAKPDRLRGLIQNLVTESPNLADEIWSGVKDRVLANLGYFEYLLLALVEASPNLADEIWSGVKDQVLANLGYFEHLLLALVETSPNLADEIWSRVKDQVLARPGRFAKFASRFLLSGGPNLTSKMWVAIKDQVTNHLDDFKHLIINLAETEPSLAGEIWGSIKDQVIVKAFLFVELIQSLVIADPNLADEVWSGVKDQVLKDPIAFNNLLSTIANKPDIAGEFWDSIRDRIISKPKMFKYLISALAESKPDIAIEVWDGIRDLFLDDVVYPGDVEYIIQSLVKVQPGLAWQIWEDTRYKVLAQLHHYKNFVSVLVQADPDVADEVWRSEGKALLLPNFNAFEDLILYIVAAKPDTASEILPVARKDILMNILQIIQSKIESVQDVVDINLDYGVLKEKMNSFKDLSWNALCLLKYTILTTDLSAIQAFFASRKLKTGFVKYSSDLEIVFTPQNGVLLRHTISSQAAQAWAKVWNEGIPCAPILKIKGNEVYSIICGTTVRMPFAIHPTYQTEIFRQMDQLLSALEASKVNHGHPHNGNIVVRYVPKALLQNYLNQNDELVYGRGLNEKLLGIYQTGQYTDNPYDINQENLDNYIPVVSMIDFDQAKIL